MSKNEPVLKTFDGDNFDIITTYDNKQVILGLVVKINREKQKSEYTDFEIVGPIVRNIDSYFGFTTDALTGKKYNVFSLTDAQSDERAVKVNKFTSELTKWMLDLPEDVGVVSYSEFYRRELMEDTKDYIKQNNLPYTENNIYRIASRLKLDKIRELIEQHKQQETEPCRKRIEEN